MADYVTNRFPNGESLEPFKDWLKTQRKDSGLQNWIIDAYGPMVFLDEDLPIEDLIAQFCWCLWRGSIADQDVIDFLMTYAYSIADGEGVVAVFDGNFKGPRSPFGLRAYLCSVRDTESPPLPEFSMTDFVERARTQDTGLPEEADDFETMRELEDTTPRAKIKREVNYWHWRTVAMNLGVNARTFYDHMIAGKYPSTRWLARKGMEYRFSADQYRVVEQYYRDRKSREKLVKEYAARRGIKVESALRYVQRLEKDGKTLQDIGQIIHGPEKNSGQK
ncbi:MAG: hypothetical protein KKF41_08710 [Actinobacteria bacterium]|nr:hypothetical protein [Actinomycetota bacterium]MBU1942922.1 hypothetical protein [Actinomycetota bacterium]MBU2687653.1 hypothetical protein [Actinomycetota bacterium]